MNAIRLLSEFHPARSRWPTPGAGRSAQGERGDGPHRWRRRPGGWPTPRAGSWESGASGATSRRWRWTTLGDFHFPDDLWANLIYDLAIAAASAAWRWSSWWRRWCRSTSRASPASSSRRRNIRRTQAEALVERQARAFELAKPTSSSAGPRWRGDVRRGPARRRPKPPAREPPDGRRAAPVAHPHPARQPPHRGRPGPHRRRAAGPADGRAHGARHRRGARGRAALRGRHPGTAGAATPAAGARVRARGHRHPHRRPHRPPRRRPASWRWPPRRRPTSSSSAGAARPGRTAMPGTPVISPTIDEVIRDSPCDIAVVKQRGAKDIRRILVPVRGGPHAELALRVADALAIRHGATVAVDARRAVRRDEAVRAQAGARARRVRAPARDREAPSRSSRETDDVRRHPARGRASRARRHGRDAPPSDAGSSLFGALPEAIGAAGEADRHRRQDARCPSPGRPSQQRAEKAETLEAAEPAASRSRVRRRPRSTAGSPSRTSVTEFTDLGRLVALKEKQGLTISLVLPTLNEAETIGPIVRTARPRADGAVPAARRAPRHRLRLDRRHSRDRRGRRARASSVTRTCCRGTAPSGARARRSGRACTRRPATRSPGRTRTCATGTTASSTARSVRCSRSRGCSTSRATTSGRSSRAASSRRAAAGASRSSSRDRW